MGWGSRGKDSLPGIDYASVGYGQWGEGMAVAVRCDFLYAGGGNGVSSGGLAQTTYDGNYVLNGRPVLDYQCRVVEDGKTGKIKIGGRTLDLADGSLILVSTAGGGIRLKQLKRDTLKMKPEQEVFKEMARTDTEVSAFFSEGRQVKTEKTDTDLEPMSDPDVDRRAYERLHQ